MWNILAVGLCVLALGCARQSRENPPGAGTSGQVGNILLVGNLQQGTGQKVLVATFHFDSTGVRPAEAVVGFGPQNPPQTDRRDYQLQLVNGQGKVLAEYGIADPRRVVVEKEGLVLNPSGVYAARFAFHPQARQIQVLDAQGRVVARSDMAGVIREFCERLKDDKDCIEARRYQ